MVSFFGFLVLAMSLTIPTFAAVKNTGVEVQFDSQSGRHAVIQKIGIPAELFNALTYNKLTTLAYLGECGLAVNHDVILRNIGVYSYENSAKADITYLNFKLSFDKVVLTYDLVKNESTDYNANSVFKTSYKCVR